MDKQTWIGVKQHQISLYKKRAKSHTIKRYLLLAACIITGILGVILPWIEFSFNHIASLGFFILIPVSILIWKLSTHENRSRQLLLQLANAIERAIKRNRPLKVLKKDTAIIETRFLSNDDELFVKKALWQHFMDYKKRKRDEEIRYEREYAKYLSEKRKNLGFSTRMKPMKQPVFFVPNIRLGEVWSTDMPHRQGYKDSNTIRNEWAIIKALRRLRWAGSIETFEILNATSDLAKTNPVMFERYLRKKSINKKMKWFKIRAGVHYLSPAAKMRLVTFVEEVLSLEPTDLNPETVTLLHEKNEQIQKYTNEFWTVHKRSIKFYWFEAIWLLLMIPFIAGALNLFEYSAYIEAIIVFTIGASLVAFGEMALIVRQKIKLNGKKLIPPLIASLIGSRHLMCAEEEEVENHRRRFKNLEKHFIMTTSEIDSVKYVKDNLRDEERTSQLHAAEDICQEAQSRMDTYYKMFHLYRRRCLQYGALELFMAIMLIPVWGFALVLAAYGIIGAISMIITLSILAFEVAAIYRHIRVWRFKEMYFKMYQGLSVLIVDGDLRQEPDKLENMFKQIEESALIAICNDPAMNLMAGTLSRVSGIPIPQKASMHSLDIKVQKIVQQRRERRKNRWSRHLWN